VADRDGGNCRENRRQAIVKFLTRLDFWGELIDILGLAVLLSHDVSWLGWLHELFMLTPRLQRLTRLGLEIHKGTVQFIKSFPASLGEERLATLHATDAATFVRLFPDRKKVPLPEDVDAIAINLAPNVQDVSVWIYAAEVSVGPITDNQTLAGPIPYSDFVNQTERQKQNLVYSAGFVLMAIGSVLLLIQIAMN
jgi:hypothetical protein